MRNSSKKQVEEEKQRKREEMLRQAQLIQKLAVRLPWIVMGISLLAFIIIFLQALYFK